MDAGDGERPAAVQRRERGQHQRADGGEEDGRVERLGGRGVGVPGAGRTQLEGQRLGLRSTGSSRGRGRPWARATCAVMCAEPPKP